MPLTEGQSFAGYEIVGELGRGGMGSVFLARQSVLGRTVALKVLNPHLASDKEFIDRFRVEAVAAAHLNHPNIVQVFAAGESDGLHFIAMEHVEGETIQQRLRRCGRLPLTEALDVAYHVAAALDHAWQTAWLVHRDVKPDNIFLAQSGTVKLGDFGLAKMMREGMTHVTATGLPMGSPHFISPEQARGQRDIDFRADVYSLGCALHYMMTGRTVFEGPDFVSIVVKHVNEAPAPLSTLLPQCPRPVNGMLMRMLAKDRLQRPQSYAELIDEIVRIRELAAQWQQDAAARRKPIAPASPTTRHSLGAYGAAVAALVFIAAFGFYARRTKTAAPPVVRGAVLSDPSDRRDFAQAIAGLAPSEQVDRVMMKLRDLNPAFAGKGKYTVEDDAVTELSFASDGATNLWPLCALRNLRALRCPAGLDQRSHTRPRDLAAVGELWIDELDISGTDVRDLSPLAKLPLRLLRCANTRVQDLAPLQGLALTGLDISGTRVNDLAVLRDMPLEWFRCSGTRVRDLAALRNAPLKALWCDKRLLTPDLLSSWPLLETINDLPAAEVAGRVR